MDSSTDLTENSLKTLRNDIKDPVANEVLVPIIQLTITIMRIAYFTILAALATQAAAHLPSNRYDLGAGFAEVARSSVHDGLAPRSVLLSRTNDGGDGGDKPTKMWAAGDASGADAAVVGVISTADGPKILGNALSDARKAQLEALFPTLGVSGGAGSVLAIPGEDGDPAKVLMLAGVGKTDGPEDLRRAAGVALRSALGTAKVAVMLPTDSDETLQAVAEGASLGAYTFTEYKTTPQPNPVAEIIIVTTGNGDLVNKADVIAKHVKESRSLTNTPANVLYPETMVDHVNEAVQGLNGVTVEVWDVPRLQQDGMGGILGVGQGSVRPPRLIKVSYNPEGSKGHVAIVGKGITFDSGGLSLKPSAGMWEMKGDMSGSATALHAVLAGAEIGVKTRMTAWLCMAENMPDGGAQRNGDVVKFYNGKTAEIWNTDAEGRLVMADGLAIAATEKPDLLFDIATLTGAQVTALGDRVAGLMGDDKAIKALEAAAAVTSEGFWAMPFPEEMFADMVSITADLRNIGAGTDGGMLKAGIFLKSFAGDGGNWGHLDVAGPAFNGGAAFGFTPKEGTGFALRTLVKVAEQLNA
jgi:leucyl aminopeptidase